MTGVVVLLVLTVLVLLALAAWLSWTANRLDRMHHRIDVSRATLEARLLRRSGTVLELAATDALDPPSRLVLLDAAHRARSATPGDLEVAESALSQALRVVLGVPQDLRTVLEDHPEVAPLTEELTASCAEVELARRFHNDAVVTARALRSRRRVRWFRLAGQAARPGTVDLDDRPPEALRSP